MQCRLGVPRPRAARATRPRPPPPSRRPPCRKLLDAARLEGLGPAGPSGSAISPVGSSDGGGCRTPQFLPASPWALSPGAPSRGAAPLWTPLTSRAGYASAVAGGKFALPAARGSPPVFTCLPKPGSPEDRGADRAGAARPLALARSFLPHFPGPARPGLPCAPAREGKPSARVHPPPPPPALNRLAGAEGQCGVTAPCRQRELPQSSRAERLRCPLRSRRRPAAPLRDRGRALPCCRFRPPHLRPQCTRALALTSPERHMSSPALGNVPLQRRSGRGRQTLTKCALASGRLSGGGGLRARGWARFGIGHISDEVSW